MCGRGDRFERCDRLAWPEGEREGEMQRRKGKGEVAQGDGRGEQREQESGSEGPATKMRGGGENKEMKSRCVWGVREKKQREESPFVEGTVVALRVEGVCVSETRSSRALV